MIIYSGGRKAKGENKMRRMSAYYLKERREVKENGIPLIKELYKNGFGSKKVIAYRPNGGFLFEENYNYEEWINLMRGHYAWWSLTCKLTCRLPYAKRRRRKKRKPKHEFKKLTLTQIRACVRGV